MPSPDGCGAPGRHKPLADADAPGKQRRVKGKPFRSRCPAPLPGPGLGGTHGVLAGLLAVPAVPAVVAVGCAPRCEVLDGAAARFRCRLD